MTVVLRLAQRHHHPAFEAVQLLPDQAFEGAPLRLGAGDGDEDVHVLDGGMVAELGQDADVVQALLVDDGEAVGEPARQAVLLEVGHEDAGVLAEEVPVVDLGPVLEDPDAEGVEYPELVAHEVAGNAPGIEAEAVVGEDHVHPLDRSRSLLTKSCSRNISVT